MHNEKAFMLCFIEIPVPRLFPVPNFSDTGSETFFRYQIFPIPVPILFYGTKFFRYRYRDFFPVPIFSDTGSDTTKKMKNSRYRYVELCYIGTQLSINIGTPTAFSLLFSSLQQIALLRPPASQRTAGQCCS